MITIKGAYFRNRSILAARLILQQLDRDLPVPGYWLGACFSDGQPYTCSYAQLLVLDGHLRSNGRQSGSNTCLGSI
jgi:hypothetical protein